MIDPIGVIDLPSPVYYKPNIRPRVLGLSKGLKVLRIQEMKQLDADVSQPANTIILRPTLIRLKYDFDPINLWPWPKKNYL